MMNRKVDAFFTTSILLLISTYIPIYLFTYALILRSDIKIRVIQIDINFETWKANIKFDVRCQGKFRLPSS
jgi:hypothetical protein